MGTDGFRAIVVGGVDFGDAHKIIRLLTPDEGRLSLVARAARKSRKRYGGILEPGTRLVVQRGRGRGDLDALTGADLEAAPRLARADLDRIALLAYGCELCAALAPEAHPAEKLFHLLEVWLDLLESDVRPADASRLALEAKALTFAGLTPTLERCAACGRDITDPAVFDDGSGGALHQACGGGRPISAAVLQLTENLRRTPLARTLGLAVPTEGTWLLSDFVQYQLGRALKSRSLLEELART